MVDGAKVTQYETQAKNLVLPPLAPSKLHNTDILYVHTLSSLHSKSKILKAVAVVSWVLKSLRFSRSKFYYRKDSERFEEWMGNPGYDSYFGCSALKSYSRYSNQQNI